MTTAKTICIAGASGLVGANLTKTALARGYTVHGTLRDSADDSKTRHLNALPGAAERLHLFSADMAEPESLQAPLRGADAVFIACLVPTYAGPSGTPAREMDDDQGHREIVMPTVDGCLNLLRCATEAGISDAVICSSTSSTNPVKPVAAKNEVDHWSDAAHQYAQKKYTSAAKTVMEQAAFDFAAEHNMRLVVFLPTLMLGPAVLPQHAESGFQGNIAKMMRGGEPRHNKVPNDSTSMIHVEDLANLFVTAYETPNARGRYFGVYDSWHYQDVYDEIARLLPDAKRPQPHTGARAEATGFDFARRDNLGVMLRDIPTILRETVASLR